MLRGRTLIHASRIAPLVGTGTAVAPRLVEGHAPHCQRPAASTKAAKAEPKKPRKPKAKAAPAPHADATAGVDATPLSPEVLQLLADPAVLSFLRAVQAGEVTIPGGTKAAPSTPPSPTPGVSAAAGGEDASAVGEGVSWAGVKGVEDAIAAGFSPWTAPFEFKPCFNVRGGSNFAPHHRRLIEARVASSVQAKHQFPVRWVGTYFAESFPAPRKAGESHPEVALPPPATLLDMTGTAKTTTAADAAAVAARRTFAPLAAYTDESAAMLAQTDPPLSARCGLTGKFYSREEVVDTLLHAAAVRQYKNPFWIAPDHPRLKSGYIELKPEEKPTIVPVVALVFPATRVRVDRLSDRERALLHPAWLDAAKRAAGMNMFTGVVSENPAMHRGDFAGGWATLDQLTAAGVQIARDTAKPRGRFSFGAADLDGGVFAAVQEFALYNADQLEKPGRLGLIREEDRDVGNLFQPLY